MTHFNDLREGSALWKSGSPEQRRILNGLSESWRPTDHLYPSRLPPLHSSVQQLFDDTTKHTGNAIRVEAPPQTLHRLTQTGMTIEPGKNAFWPLVQQACKAGGLRLHRIDGQTMVLTETGEAHRMVAYSGSAALLVPQDTATKAEPMRQPDVLLANEPGRGTMLNLRDARIIQGEDVRLALWPRKHASWREPPYPSHTFITDKHLTGNGTMDTIIEVTVAVGTQAESLTVPLSSAETPEKVTSARHAIGARLVRDGDVWIIEEDHAIRSDVPWPSSTYAFDYDAFRLGEVKERTLTGEGGASIPFTVETIAVTERNMKTRIRCNGNGKPQTMAVRVFGTIETQTHQFVIAQGTLGKNR